MEVKNIQTIIVGEGKHIEDVYLTVDLIPVHVVIKYDLVYNGFIYHAPDYICNLYNKDVYQQLLNMVCKKINVESRDIFYTRDRPPVFNFKKDEYFWEPQYLGSFSRMCYTSTKIKNALKFWDQYSRVLKGWHDKDDLGMYKQLDMVNKSIMKQKIFTNRDHFILSKSTTDRFINSLISACNK